MAGQLDLSGVFGAAFGPIYGDATLRRITITHADDGTRSRSVSTAAVKAQQDELSEAARVAAGYTAKESRFLVLQSGAGVMPRTDDELVYGGATYAVKAVTADPASTHWVVRAEKV